MATRYAVGSGLWSDTTSVWSDTDGGSAGSYVPVDGDTVVICAGVEVQVDVDQSAWTGMIGMTVRGGASPGMVYWKDGASGILKFAGSTQIVGTTVTNNGRILANSDGDWDTTTSLSSSYYARIILTATAYINCTNLDVKMYCAEPTRKYVRTYGTKYDFNGATAVDTSDNTIDLGTTPPAAGTAVMVTSASGTLPAPVIENCTYYIRGVSGNTCKLSYKNDDSNIVEFLAVGSGTCTLFTGYAAGSATVNVLEDVTADLWAADDRIVLCDSYQCDVQFLTIDTVNAGTMVLSTTVDSVQYPGARIYLSQRNCSVHNDGTSHCFYYGIGLVLGEVSRATVNGYQFYKTSQSVVSVVSGGNTALRECSSMTVEIICGQSNGSAVYSHFTVAGNSRVSHVAGVSAVFYNALGVEVEEAIGAVNAFFNSSYCRVGTVIGANSLFNGGWYCFVDKALHCTGFFGSGGDNIVGVVAGVHSDFYGGNSNAICQYVLAPVLETGGTYYAYSTPEGSQRQYILNFAQTDTVTAGDGTPVPDQRSGGAGTLIALSHLQAWYYPGFATMWRPETVKVWAEASVAKTYRFYIQSTYALTADEIELTARYYSGAYCNSYTKSVSDEAVAARSGITDWSQYVEVSVTPGHDSWVFLDLSVRKYSSGGYVYVDPQVVVS